MVHFSIKRLHNGAVVYQETLITAYFSHIMLTSGELTVKSSYIFLKQCAMKAAHLKGCVARDLVLCTCLESCLS